MKKEPKKSPADQNNTNESTTSNSNLSESELPIKEMLTKEDDLAEEGKKTFLEGLQNNSDTD